MKSAKLSLQVFAIYVILVPGLSLVLFPVDLFEMLGSVAPVAEDVWAVRMVGYLAFALGVYYWYMGSLELWKIYPITVVMRYGVALFMVILWLSGEADPSIIGFATIDFLGATWTLIAMRANKNPSSE